MFDKLNKLVPVLQRDNNGKPPELYIETIAELETATAEAAEKQKVNPKKTSKIASQGLNAMRQKIRRNNREFTTEIEAFRADPDEYMKEEIVEQPVATPKKKKTTFDISQDLSGDEGGFTIVGAGGRAVTYTPESILKHLRSLKWVRD